MTEEVGVLIWKVAHNNSEKKVAITNFKTLASFLPGQMSEK
jgi:hypothetical protein